MKAHIYKNGTIKLILVPDEGDEIEAAAIKQIAKGEVEVTLIETNTPILDHKVQGGIVISPKIRKD